LRRPRLKPPRPRSPLDLLLVALLPENLHPDLKAGAETRHDLAASRLGQYRAALAHGVRIHARLTRMRGKFIRIS
jgi:hypothetical protein